MDMSNLPQEFRERIERLERNFEVSTVIFKKFEPIFLDIFQNPYEEHQSYHEAGSRGETLYPHIIDIEIMIQTY